MDRLPEQEDVRYIGDITVRTFTKGLCHHNKQDCVSGSSLRRARVTVPESLRACTEQSVSKDNGKKGVFCSEIVPCGTPSAARWAGRSAGVTEHAHCCFPTEQAPRHCVSWSQGRVRPLRQRGSCVPVATSLPWERRVRTVTLHRRQTLSDLIATKE
ncbi:unnamed protein product [Gadus morhua 'NCC']